MSQWPIIWERLKLLAYTAPAILAAIVFHEMAHGWASYWLGDPTPKEDGRLSIAPWKHLDPVGILCMILFHFGWARPVQVRPQYYKNPKLGMAVTAVAGPLANFLLAFAASGLYVWMFKADLRGSAFLNTAVGAYLMELVGFLVSINIGLGVFNLIPIPPLDGAKVLGAVLPERLYFRIMPYERYGTILLVALLYIGVLDGPLGTARAWLIDTMFSGWL